MSLNADNAALRLIFCLFFLPNGLFVVHLFRITMNRLSEHHIHIIYIMKKIILVAFMLYGSFASAQQTIEPPTMGWSSWNTFGVNISESIIKGQADAMVSQGFSKVGYKYINVDDGFFGGRNKETGELIIHPTRFPNGIKVVADYIHSKGLKAGIYSDAGANTCGNYHNGDVLSVNVGLYNYDQRDADFYFKECGFDFIKVDFCGGDPIHNSDKLKLDEKTRYQAIHNAIVNTGRSDVRLNICRWAYPGNWARDISCSWRTTGDIGPWWSSVKSIIEENLYLSAYCGGGHYNDMDMLEVGKGMTNWEDQCHFGMWCVMSSPLLIGCNMKDINTTAKNLLKNTELIAFNQDTLGLQAYVVKRIKFGDGNAYVLVKDIIESYGKTRVVAFYNPTDSVRTMEVNTKDLELAGVISVRDAINRKDLDNVTDVFSVKVPIHGVRIYKLTAEERLERTLYEAETAYLSAYQEIANHQSSETAIYESNDNASGGMVAGWLGRRASNDLQWKNVYSKTGGNYKMSLAYVSGESRSLTLEVNGKKVKSTSLNSGSWSTIKNYTFEVTLNPGENVVRLYNTSSWMPSIDYMKLEKIAETNSIGAVKSYTKKSKIYSIDGKSSDNINKGVYVKDGKKIIM